MARGAGLLIWKLCSFLARLDPPSESYRTLSRSAVTSVILALISLLACLVWPFVVIAAVAVVLGVTAMSTIRRYPDEYVGMGAGLFGAVIGACSFTGGAALHIYEYSTEVPEGYSRISFTDLQPDLKNPKTLVVNRGAIVPKRAADLNGQQVFIKGYIHPGVATMGKVDHFVLVPDMGTCCFGGQPKATDMIEVRIKPDASRVKYSTRTVKLAGKFILADHSSEFGELHSVVYHLEADVAR